MRPSGMFGLHAPTLEDELGENLFRSINKKATTELRDAQARIAELEQELADVYRQLNGGDGITISIGNTAQYPPQEKE